MAEMDNYEPDFYTDKVREDAQKLMEEVTPIFTQRVAAVIDALDKDPPDEVDENEFIGELKIWSLRSLQFSEKNFRTAEMIKKIKIKKYSDLKKLT